jgi:hypothetical protein
MGQSSLLFTGMGLGQMSFFCGCLWESEHTIILKAAGKYVGDKPVMHFSCSTSCRLMILHDPALKVL